MFKLLKQPLLFIQQLLCFKHIWEYEHTMIGDKFKKTCRKCNKEEVLCENCERVFSLYEELRVKDIKQEIK